MILSPRFFLTTSVFVFACTALAFGHGTAVSPISRVRLVYESNPENPSFELAQNAVALDGTSSYYNWNELSRNIPAAVQADLPPGFDYSPWVPDGQIASGGRTDPTMGRTYLGLDQVSPDWPTTPITAGKPLTIDFLATAPHDPSVWDVWMTSPNWEPTSPLTWLEMEFLGRPDATLVDGHYFLDVDIPGDRSGHHVVWIAWQRDDPVGEVFFSTSDVYVSPDTPGGDFNVDGLWNCADVDMLTNAILSDSVDLTFDLNDDGLVSPADVTDDGNGWLAIAGSQNIPLTAGNPFLPGDANLDGHVDGQDFVIWNGAKFTASGGWCEGDFSIDGFVDGSDFVIWNSNKFTSSQELYAVPEPGAGMIAIVVALFAARCRIR